MPTPRHVSRTARPVCRQAASPDPAVFPAFARAGTKTGGRPLDRHTQARMSARFGHDFSQVRVHTDAPAGDSAAALGANAFAHGSDVVFGAGQWTPGSPQTERLLAHELTHVVQQDRWGVGDWGRASARGDASEREADGLAAQVMAGRGVDVRAAPEAAVARDEADPSTLVSTTEEPSAMVSSLDDPGPDISAPISAPGLPDLPLPTPPPPARADPAPAGFIGPTALPPDPEDVSSPLDPSSRVCSPDPDPADVSCAEEPPHVALADGPWPAMPPFDWPTLGQEPGDQSGPYFYKDLLHSKMGMMHTHDKTKDSEYTSDYGYANHDLGEWDTPGGTRYGVRGGAGMADVNYRHDSPDGSWAGIGLQGMQGGGEASVGGDGFTLGGGTNEMGVTLAGHDAKSSTTVRAGIDAGESLGVRGHWGKGQDGYYGYGVGADYGPFSLDVTTSDPLGWFNRMAGGMDVDAVPGNKTDQLANLFGYSIRDVEPDAQSGLDESLGQALHGGEMKELERDLPTRSSSVEYEVIP